MHLHQSYKCDAHFAYKCYLFKEKRDSVFVHVTMTGRQGAVSCFLSSITTGLATSPGGGVVALPGPGLGGVQGTCCTTGRIGGPWSPVTVNWVAY